ncbi:MAG: ABC transporter permease [Sciscionella sp.]
MSWVAWRQQRLLLLVVTALVAVVAGVLLFYRLDALSYLDGHGLRRCMLAGGTGCPSAGTSAFDAAYGGYGGMVPFLLLALPLLVGMFAGAPLFAREYEQETHIFALTQSISRNRWWATKLLSSGVPVLVLTLALGLVSAWAMEPFAAISPSRLRVPGFETQGLVVGAYTLLAFAIGASAGLLIRNTLGAMAITIGGYFALIVTVANAARPHYLASKYLLAPVERTENGPFAVGPRGVPAGSWRVRSGFLDRSGHGVVVSGPDSCFEPAHFVGCLKRNGVVSTYAEYHPPSQFWSFQLIESCVVLAIVVVLLGLGAWGLHRRPY